MKDLIKQLHTLTELSWLEATATTRNHILGATGIWGCKPTNVTIEVTSHCSLRCQMCGIWKTANRDEISSEEWIKIIDALKEWLGTFKLTITGGEPFVKSGIWELLSHCVAINLPVVVLTNGYSLSTEQVRQLCTLQLTQVVLSLDSLNAESHDRLRGVSGALQKTLETLSLLTKHDRSFLLGTSTIITDRNLLELGSIARKLDVLGVERIFFQPVQGGFAMSGDTGWPYNSKLWPTSSQRVEHGINSLLEAISQGIPVTNSVSEIEYFRDYLLQGSNWQRPWSCIAGYTAFFCSAFGQVKLCAPSSNWVGNLRQASPAKIWNSKEAENERARIEECKEACLLNCYRKYDGKEKLRYARQWLKRFREF